MLALTRADAPWAFAYVGKSYALRHGWMAPRTPNLMANNTLKYVDLDPARRVAYQQRWNRPALWPVAAVLALGALVLVLAWRAWRRRERSTVEAL
jgi:GH15 family glucan-1,4-alpha-glucosidase